jgi:hypothetical protein
VSVGEFAQLLTALAVVGNCAISWRNSRKIDAGKADIKELAQNTNSIKDALVKTTALASEAKGMAAGLKQARDEAAAKEL